MASTLIIVAHCDAVGRGHPSHQQSRPKPTYPFRLIEKTEATILGNGPLRPRGERSDLRRCPASMPCRAAVPASHRNCSNHKTRRGFDPRIVDEQVQRTRAGLVGNGDIQTLLAAQQGAEVWRRPIEPGKRNRLSTRPVVCRNGSPNSAFNVRHAWIAASVNVAGRPRFPPGSARHTVFALIHICSEPRCFRAAL